MSKSELNKRDKVLMISILALVILIFIAPLFASGLAIGFFIRHKITNKQLKELIKG